MNKIILSSIALCFFCFGAFSQKKQLSDYQLLNLKRTSPIMRPVEWLNDTVLLCEKRSGNDIRHIIVNAKTGEKTVISDDRSKSLDSGRNNVYLKDDEIMFGNVKITDTKGKKNNPELSPDGKFVAFTMNNDLYAIRLSDKKEFRLTDDGSDVILNGYASWVYMEEILGRRTAYKAFRWSPESKRIAFFRFDDSEVPLYTITDSRGKHGYVETMRYPKAGDKNPAVRIGIADVENNSITWADFENEEDRYFGAPFWFDEQRLGVRQMNRDQNELILYSVNVDDGKKTEVYKENQKTWISLEDNKVHSLSDSRIIMSSDKTGYNHLYLLSPDGKPTKPVTSGKFTVLDIKGVDEKNKAIYFTCYKDNIACIDFYRVNFDGKNLQRLSFGNYTNNVSISPDCKYYFLSYGNFNTPVKSAVYTSQGKLVKEIHDTSLPESEQYEWPETELVTVKSADGKFDLPMSITRPTNREKDKKYPVIVNVYGGPSNTQVRMGNPGSLSGLQNFYSKEGLIQVSPDHRGSLHFGKIGQEEMYKNLGSIEVNDYAQCVKWLIENEQADPDKICITGFSYGGFTTCYALVCRPDVFTHGIAGGSVTDWQLYDAPYTERYMSTPEKNPEGYKNSSVMTHAENLKGKLLLTHGVSDENVHLQNTMQLVDRLEDSGKDFELVLYPGERHGYRGAKRDHFNKLQIKFIYKYLFEKPVPEILLK